MSEKDKQTFVFRCDWLEAMDVLSGEDFKATVIAICKYVTTGETNDLPATANMAFRFIKPWIDKDQEKYNQTRERRSEAGRIGGKATQSKNKQNRQMLDLLKQDKQTKANQAVTDTDTDTVTVTDTYTDTEIGKSADKPHKRTRFIPPSVEEVAAYCSERNNGIDPERFVDYYAARDWKLNTAKMKDWKAAIRTWEKNGKNSRMQRNKTNDLPDIDDYLKVPEGLTVI